MPSEVTLSLENPQAWQVGLTFQQNYAAGTSYDSMMRHNYAKRAACISPVRTFGLDTVIEAASGYQVYVAAFDADLKYLGYNASGSSMGWKPTPYTFSSEDAEYICIAVKTVPSEVELTDELFETMSMTVTLAGGGGSMTDILAREEAYEANVITGWEAFAYSSTANNANGKFRNAGGGNGVRTWGLSEGGLPMGAGGYMSIDTTPASCTNIDNTIAQDSVPLVTGEVYTIGAFVRGKGFFTCGPTQDNYYRCGNVSVDHPNWRFYGGEFTAKSASQNMYWRNETVSTDDYAGALEICAPLLVRGGVAPVIIATDTETLAVAVDVQQVDTYYYQTASTGSAPSKPTAASPSGWQTAEYAFDASKAVWSCQKTTLTDGTFYWGAVSKWSAYEGSVVAWNKANAAQTAVDSMEIGGRNLLGRTDNPTVPTDSTAAASMTFGSIGRYNSPASEFTIESYDGDSNSIIVTSSVTGNRGLSWYTKPGGIEAGQNYTFSCRVKTSVSASVHTHTAWRNGSATATYTGWTYEGDKTIPADTWTDYSFTFKPASNAQLNWEFLVSICFSGATTGITMRVAHAKLEKGDKATDWTPAPEDLEAAIDEAASVAGNYIIETASNDVWIHSEGHGPDTDPSSQTYGQATSNTYGWRIGSVFELVRAGLSCMMLWVESSVTKLRLGLATAGHAILSPDGMEVFAGTNGADSVAKFGSETRIGKSGGARFVTNASSLQAYDSSNEMYFEVSSSGLTWGTSTAATTTQVNEAAKRTYVSIRVTAIDYMADTATLQATLYVDGTAKTSSVTYAWLKDGTAMSGETARTLSVTTAKGGLEHAYSCTVTY